MQKAEHYISSTFPNYTRTTQAYRNSSEDYFNEIKNKDGIMRVSMTDYTGDQRNPMNGQIKGLYFGVTLFQGILPDKSPFGPTRVIVPLDKLITAETKAYFADFYCFNTGNHYVRLVFTREGTEADRFCEKYLIQLNINDNPFLSKKSDAFYYCCALWVEFLYTENVDLNENYVRWEKNIQPYSTGWISRDKPKYMECSICNI